MDSKEIFQSIQAIVNGDSSRIEIAPLLWEHQCYYLLSLLQKNPYSLAMKKKKFLNQQAVQARFETCKPFFEKICFPYTVIKGPVLSMRAYQDIAVRSSGDVDILIQHADVEECTNLLWEQGFRQGYVREKKIFPFSRKEILFHNIYTHQLAPFIKQSNSIFCPYINVDINTNVYWGEALESIDLSTILHERTEIKLEQNGSIFVLTPEMDFICLCLHHYKDLNSVFLLFSKNVQLSSFCDIFYYLKNNRLDLEKLLFFSKTLHAGKYIYYCLFFCNQIFSDKMLQSYLDLFFPFQETCLQDCFGLGEKKHYWTLPFEERLFCKDLKSIILPLLSAKEIKGIQMNLQNLH